MIIETNEEDYSCLIDGRAPRDYRLADSAIAPLEILKMLAGVAAGIRAQFQPASWLIVEDGEVVGMCSITKPPSGGVVDIGYGIAPSRQRRGIASRAIGDVVRWAKERPDVSVVRAETSVENLPSQRVLVRNAFQSAGARVDDEDGPLICWRHNLR